MIYGGFGICSLRGLLSIRQWRMQFGYGAILQYPNPPGIEHEQEQEHEHEAPCEHLQPAARVQFSVGIPEGLPSERERTAGQSSIGILPVGLCWAGGVDTGWKPMLLLGVSHFRIKWRCPPPQIRSPEHDFAGRSIGIFR
jgi:hypothetical protein